MQYIVERAIRSVGRAACVVVDKNGQILAMASVPSYDPNNFIPAISARDWAIIKDAESDPLTNRAIRERLLPRFSFLWDMRDLFPVGANAVGALNRNDECQPTAL